MEQPKGHGVHATVGALIMLVMLMLISSQAIAVDDAQRKCLDNCITQCDMVSIPFVCLDECEYECGITLGLYYYCNLGCSHERCTKFGHEGEKMKGCLKECSSKHCII